MSYSMKLKSRWLNRSEQDLPVPADPSTKSPSTGPVGSSTPITSGSNSYHNNDVSSSSSSIDQDKNSVERTMIPDTSPVMPNFEKIQDNLYLLKEKTKTKSKDSKRMICECSLPEDENQNAICCGNDCLNRILYIECGSKCRCGERCSNRRFQKHEYGPVEPFPAGAKGWGLQAVAPIPKGTFVMEYVGEVLNSKQFRQRTKQYGKDPAHQHHYFMALKSDEVIDATHKGNVSRFINHSCQPNCETQKWTVDGRLRIGFFAIRDVDAGDEITFDYRFQRYGKEAQKCYCGTSACRGFIGGDSPPMATTQRRQINRDIAKKKKEKEPQPSPFEDMLFDQELSELLVIGSLKNRDQVVTYCRLMVRAEDIVVRMQLLDILKNTDENCLRSFIDHHGCQLLWSWMVDDQRCNTSWSTFQLAVLEILKRLPIPHRNMVQDSRLLSIVQRWAKDPVSRLANHKTSPRGDDEVIRTLVSELLDQIVSNETPGTSDGATPLNDDSNDAEQPQQNQEKEVIQLAEAVLAQWANLKENFRIPKKAVMDDNNKSGKGEYVKTSSKHDRDASPSRRKRRGSSARRSRSRSVSSRHRHKRTRTRSRSRSRSHRSRTRSRSRSRSRSRGGSGHRSRYPRRSRSPSWRHRSDHYSSKWKNDHRRTPERSSVMAATPTDNRKSKEERRREFEAHVLKQQQEEEEKKIREAVQMQPLVPVTYGVVGATGVYWQNSASSSSAGIIGATTNVSASTPTAATSGASIAKLIFDPHTNQHWWQEQSTKVLVYAANESQVAAVSNGDFSRVPHFYHDAATGLIHEVCQQPPAVVPPSVDDLDEVDMACDEEPLSRENRIAILKQEISNLEQQLIMKKAEVQWLLDHDDDSSVSSLDKITSLLPPGWKAARDSADGSLYYYHEETKRTQWEMPQTDGVKQKQKEKHIPPPPKKADRHHQLQKHQKTKTAQHLRRKVKPEISKRVIDAKKAAQKALLKPATSLVKAEVKMEPEEPVVEAEIQDNGTASSDNSKEEEIQNSAATPITASAAISTGGSGSVPSTSDVEAVIGRTPNGTTMAAADTSSEVAKKLKENFKAQVSNHVIKYLGPYRKSDCKVGKITSNDDFKHLARKLTHAVMEKELKQHGNRVEDLRVTESVLHKAKDYVKKYMAKIGSEYKRSNISP